MDSFLQAKVDEWLRLDKNEDTLDEIRTLVGEGNVNELRLRMSERIEFGTAGLRGRMEAGWNRMNDLVVIQASQGLCAYMLKVTPDAKEKGIVIGHDHRHHSADWAKLVAMVFLNKGFKVYLHQDLVHTPLVPFSVSRLGAAGGVMITASHNPKDDNGYKVYWENAVQIISPHDVGIAECITENLEPASWDTRIIDVSPLCQDVTEDINQAYDQYLSSLCLWRGANSTSRLRFVNTSMHGVGHVFAVRAFDVFGLPPFFSVRPQQTPDPEFPTVKFPNPEEKGALNLAIQEADTIGALYVLAQDPDADRFAAAEKQLDGTWTMFTGDQLGAIFAARCIAEYKNSGKPMQEMAMVASTVSSKMLEAMAMKEGFRFEECLTGFKYIGNTALALAAEGFEVPFGYEEAIGFMFGSQIRDKDGIAATACFAELASSLDRQGMTVSGFLRDLYKTYGIFKTSNSYFICKDPAIIDKIFSRLRSYDETQHDGANYPCSIAGLEVISVKDLTVGYDSTNPPTYRPRLPLSSGHMIQFRAEGKGEGIAASLTIRTSGTEPKIKYYLEGSGKDTKKVEECLSQVIAELRDSWMEAEANGLLSP